jgi:hypothetical protein
MNTVTYALGALALALSALPSAQAAPAAKGDIPLTLTGCVVAGDAKDTYLLTGVTIEGMGPRNSFFRMDSNKELQRQVGHRVEITGTADVGDVDKGTLKVQTEDGKTSTSVTSERKTVKTEDNVWFGSEGSTKLKADIVTYGFHIKNVKRLEGNCSK